MRTVLRYPGAKWRVSDWLVSHFPPHRFYLEPFFGSGAAFFAKPPSAYEIINDLDGNVVNFFRVCRDYPDELARAVALTPYARMEFEAVQEPRAGEPLQLTGDPVEDARRFAVRCWMGRGSKLAERAGWKNTKHSAGPFVPRLWAGLPETVTQTAQRLKNAQIECRPALELIEGCNAPDCLIYADPPYLLETRGSRLYSCEMGAEEEHIKLLEALKRHSGPVVISGYDSGLYNRLLSGWSRDSIKTHSDSAAERTEVIWMNFDNAQTRLY